MLAKRLIKSNDAGGGGGCTNTVDLYNPFPDGGGVALYQLNGDATDVSGNYNGTATNVTYGAGQFGQAGVFNGSSSRITSNVGMSVNHSVSMWIKFNSIPAAQKEFLDWFDSSTGRGLRLNTYNSNQLRFSSGSEFYYNGVTTGVWYHLAYSNGKCFINGSLVATITELTSTADNGLYIGSNQDLNRFSDCEIDQVRLFSRALRPYEVEALYTEEYCTPTIVPSEHFNTVTYTGNSSTQSITGVGFQPDLVWIKRRNTTEDHALFDSVRGALKMISSNLTAAEYTTAAPYEAVSSFDSDGFTTGDNGATNRSPNDYVAWNFKAGGAAVTNTDGTITSQVSANTEAGFSIVNWTGTGAANATVGHGLGTTPSLYITKRRDSTGNWVLFATTLLPTTGAQEFLVLNATDASSDASQPLPTSSILNVQSVFDNISSATYVSYAFAEVEGFSKFGSYVGTGTSTNTIVTGFEPAFVLIKNSNHGNAWTILDNKRNLSDPRNLGLFPSSSQVEYTFPGTPNGVSFVSNGFTLNTNQPEFNQVETGSSGGNYIYMAFAADPTAVEPTLEDSFNTVLYTGNGGSSNAITGVGFQPDLTWIKSRSINYNHQLHDSIRGAGVALYSDLTSPEGQINTMNSFDSDGFTVNASSFIGTNANGQTFVAWNWKGAEIPAINSNGSIPSVVSANPAAGFSIVSYTGSGSATTIGHGLSSAPSFVIYKDRDNASVWLVQAEATTNASLYLYLNAADAYASYINYFYTTTTSTFGLQTSDPTTNAAGRKYIAYCFAEVAGFSKFGSYNGNGSTQSINVGFAPAFVMFKRTDSTGEWTMIDNKRNNGDNWLYANLSNGEGVNINRTTLNSTGFALDGSPSSCNESGSTYIYMAFANQF
jgi:hypothetical protein